MEMFYFTLGVLTVIALVFIGVVILGMIKVSKLQKEVESVKEEIKWEFMGCSRRQDEQEVNLTKEIEHLHRRVDEKVQESISYTDKRIDKVIYHYKEKES